MALQVTAYNCAMRRMCGKHGLPFFDTVPVTAGAASFDGLHYGMDVNLLKAQLLLNFLETSDRAVQGSLVDGPRALRHGRKAQLLLSFLEASRAGASGGIGGRRRLLS